MSIEQSFDISLPESFGSELFTVKDAVLRIQDLLASGPLKTGQRVRASWAEILALEPAEEARETIRLDFGPGLGLVRYTVKLLLTLAMKVFHPEGKDYDEIVNALYGEVVKMLNRPK